MVVIVRLCLLLSWLNLDRSHRLRLKYRDFSSSFLSLLIISSLNIPVIVEEVRYVFIDSLGLARVKLMTIYTTVSVRILTCDLIDLVRGR